MKQINMDLLLKEVIELKTDFAKDQKSVPIIESLAKFIEDLIPLLGNITKSIGDSTKSIPKAANQIQDVTNATELATNEILDIVDSISNQLMDITSNLQEVVNREKSKNEVLSKLVFALKDNNEALVLLDQLKQLTLNDHVNQKLVDNLNEMCDNVNNITFSLQVQDITSQQLASVDNLIKSVYKKLLNLVNDLKQFKLSEHEEIDFDASSDERVFNAEARYDKSDEKQNFINDLIQKDGEKTSQEDIEKLFK